MPISEVFHGDCMEYMRTIPDKFFDLCIADPPYGISYSTANPTKSERNRLNQGAGKLKNRILQTDKKDWDLYPPSQDVFDEMMRVSNAQIIWGGNYFHLPPTRGIICWDKKQPWDNFSQIEMAWTSFDYPAKMFRFDNRTKDKIHPTQKPVALYAWLLDNYAIGGGKIFDPFLGSGSSRIAAYKKGFEFYACELDADYYKAQEERFQRECMGVEVCNGVTIKQGSLFDMD